jgi:hypothetical protein
MCVAVLDEAADPQMGQSSQFVEKVSFSGSETNPLAQARFPRAAEKVDTSRNRSPQRLKPH